MKPLPEPERLALVKLARTRAEKTLAKALGISRTTLDRALFGTLREDTREKISAALKQIADDAARVSA